MARLLDQCYRDRRVPGTNWLSSSVNLSPQKGGWNVADAGDPSAAAPGQAVPDEVVDAVRDFTFFWTRATSTLREGLLDTSYSLTEARVLFEFAQADAVEIADLRRRLDLNSGYLSRILTRFERDGLLTRQRSTRDARRQVVRLTATGREVHGHLEARSAGEVRKLVDGLSSAGRARLVAALRDAEGVLSGPDGAATLRRPEPGDLGWVVERHGALGAAHTGSRSAVEAEAARVVADFAERSDVRREAAWIAVAAGRRVGSVLCVRTGEGAAALRLLLVEPEVRGRGLGGRLVDECVRFARDSGYARLSFPLYAGTAAARLAERAGFRPAGEAPVRAGTAATREQRWERSLGTT
jgi:DNA-binding MarR family transcriptional regulator/GNAT superfamily N-acetyltransferase